MIQITYFSLGFSLAVEWLKLQDQKKNLETKIQASKADPALCTSCVTAEIQQDIDSLQTKMLDIRKEIMDRDINFALTLEEATVIFYKGHATLAALWDDIAGDKGWNTTSSQLLVKAAQFILDLALQKHREVTDAEGNRPSSSKT